ncbi:MAG: hypothetical protein OEY43_04350 [Gammaproteobacteria bacterium]|nr:hypothetical protein [Gammaproteobacteria bacterium]
MAILRKFIGTESKDRDDIPYAYEARVMIIDNRHEYNAYIADTICALIEHLQSKGIAPDEVDIFEIFKQDEKELNISFCVAKDGEWLDRRGLCKSFRSHYPGHIEANGCSFAEREKAVSGP